MSDTQIVNAIQTIMRTVQLDGENAFLSDSVVVDSWDYRDETEVNSPFCRIDSAVLTDSRHDDSMTQATNFWQIRATLYLAFEDWNITRPAARKLRTAVIDTFNSGNNRSLGDLSATVDAFVTSMRDEFPDTFLYVYDRYIEPEQFEEVIPIGIELPILFTVEERC